MTPLEAAVEAWFDRSQGEDFLEFNERMSSAIRAFMDAQDPRPISPEDLDKWMMENPDYSLYSAFNAGRESLRREIEEALKSG